MLAWSPAAHEYRGGDAGDIECEWIGKDRIARYCPEATGNELKMRLVFS